MGSVGKFIYLGYVAHMEGQECRVFWENLFFGPTSVDGCADRLAKLGYYANTKDVEVLLDSPPMEIRDIMLAETCL